MIVLLEDYQKIGLGVFDQAKIGMILALISDSFCLFLGHFPVFNVLKLSVSGFIRFQKQLRRKWRTCAKMSHKWEETGHFRHLDMKGRYKSAMATEDSPKASKGRYLGAT